MLQNFAAPSATLRGIVYADGQLYVSDPTTNEIYEISTSDGSVINTYDAPGSEAGPLAYDGSRIWNNDTIEKQLFALEISDDDEGLTIETKDVISNAIVGIEFIGSDMWFTEDYYNRFYNDASLRALPEATIQIESPETQPYEVGDYFYFTSRSSTQAYYLHRRVANVPAATNRQILATSNVGGALVIKETIGSGVLYAMDVSLTNENYEVARQTVPANTLFLNMLGIYTHNNGVHENTKPTYDSLVADLDDAANDPEKDVVKYQIGTASNGDPIWAYDFGRGDDKPVILLVSGLHGNEEHAFVPTVRYLENIAERFKSKDPSALSMNQHYQMTFVPLLSVPGIKNISRYNVNNVDINRNFDYDWAADISSFKGSAPFSEPETAAYRDLILGLQDRIVFMNDAHSAVSIPAGLSWGEPLGPVAPTETQDIYDIFTTRNAYKWWDEKSSVGRFLTHDRYAIQEDRAYNANWIANLGIPTGTTEVLGKKDVSTQRMIHTSSWHMEHFTAIEDSFNGRIGSAIYRISAEDPSEFVENLDVDSTGSVSVQYATNNSGATPSTWSDNIESAGSGEYLFAKITLSRDSWQDSSPQVLSASISYQPSALADTGLNVIYRALTATTIVSAVVLVQKISRRKKYKLIRF